MTPRPFRRIFRLAAREAEVGDDVDREVAAHLDQLAEWLVARGWTPAAARDEARRRFGDVDRFRRALRHIDAGTVRRRRLLERFDSLRQDVVVAARGLLRSPGYAAVLVGTLGLALGANATMFGVVDRLLLRPPTGVARPDEVRRVDVARWQQDHLTEPWDAISYPSFEGLRDGAPGLSHVAAITGSTLSQGLGGEARPVAAVFASGQYFALLGAVPALGRFFTEADDQPPAGAPVVVVSHAFWRNGLGADSTALGRPLVLNGRPHEIIGVAAPGFTGTDLAPRDLWLPLSAVGSLVHRSPEWRTAREWQWLNALVRIRPGVPETQARAEATTAYQRANSDHHPFEGRAVPSFRPLQAYSEGIGPERIAGWLYGVTILVLLVACANVANVVLARGFVRRTETAVRQALGISRGRLVRQLLVETGLVAALGLALGLGVAHWGGLAIRRTVLSDMAWDVAPLSGRVLLATGVATLVAALLASLWPLLRAARVDPAAEMHGGGRATNGLALRLRRGLLFAQTALCTVAVVAAGLFLRSIATIRSLDLGIEPAAVALVSVDLAALDAPFYERVTERIRQLPGVRAAGVSFAAPFLNNMGRGIVVPGRDSVPRLPGGGPYFFAVGPGALEAYGVRLLEGRLFTAADRRGSPPVVIVSERMARALWPGESAVGRCFHVGADTTPCREVVGVVADLHRQELEEEAFFLFFTVLAQEPDLGPQYVVVRHEPGASGIPALLRHAFLAERGDLPWISVRPYQEIIARQARPWRTGATLFAVFGALGLVIAAIGLYGVVAFVVSQRTRELGLRAALGATPRQLLGAVLGDGLATAGAGVGAGLVAALLAAPRMEALLFNTRAGDPLVFGLSAALVTVVSLAAGWFPGRRATRIDPMRALRVE